MPTASTPTLDPMPGYLVTEHGRVPGGALRVQVERAPEGMDLW